MFGFSPEARISGCRLTFMDNRRKIGDVNASLQDTLAGIRVVQSFANEDVEREKIPEKQSRVSCFPRTPTINAWEASWAGTCFSRA